MIRNLLSRPDWRGLRAYHRRLGHPLVFLVLPVLTVLLALVPR